MVGLNLPLWVRGQQKPPSRRFWEIDYCRGCAVVMMVIFHISFDLAYFGIWDADVYSGPWRLLAVCTASLFLLLVGLSLTISGSRARKNLDRRSFIMKYLRRGAGILALGFLITIVTLELVPSEPVLFGILHLIGFSVILSPLYLHEKWANLVAGLAIITAGMELGAVQGLLWLAWLGVHPPDFASLDYTPVFPWFGVVLLGVWLGHILYPCGERKAPFPFSHLPGKEVISLFGRHSLVIYLLHQPVILLVISLIWFPGGLPI